MVRCFAWFTLVLVAFGCTTTQEDFSLTEEKNSTAASDLEPIEISSPSLLFQKLPGKWIAIDSNSTFSETWNLGDNFLEGIGAETRDDGSTWEEQLRIEYRDEKLAYIAMVPDQNEGASIPFPIDAYDANSFTFHNPMHDFPQKITYHFVTDDRLNITVGGQRGEEWREFVVELVREGD